MMGLMEVNVMRGRVIIMVILISLVSSSCALFARKANIEYIPREPHRYLSEQRWAQVNGMKISYIEAGRDEPIIFIHGLAGCADNFDPLIEDLSRDYRCIVLDLPGYGNSEARPEFPYTTKFFADTVAGLMDELGIERAAVLGHSMGGQTAAYMAIHYPERVHKLVLVGSAGVAGGGSGTALLKAMPTEEIILSALRRVQKKMDGKSHEERLEYLKGLPVDYVVTMLAHKEEDEQAADPFMDPTWEYYADFIMTEEIDGFIHAVVASLTNALTEDLSADLHKIKAPTLLVWGELDKAVPVEQAAIFNREIQGSMLVVAKGCYHSVQVDCADTVIGAMRGFLSM
jgi:pimeloyl-ACP methyl ester carboxylesterase